MFNRGVSDGACATKNRPRGEGGVMCAMRKTQIVQVAGIPYFELICSCWFPGAFSGNVMDATSFRRASCALDACCLLVLLAEFVPEKFAETINDMFYMFLSEKIALAFVITCSCLKSTIWHS